MKLIPGSVNLHIDLDNKIYNNKGELVTVPIRLGKVIINLFNTKMELDIDWLKCVSWYDISPEFILLHHDKIKFCSIKNEVLRLKCGKIMTFTEPIYYCHGFRYIPCYTRYAINKNGDVFDTYKKEFKHPYKLADGYIGYTLLDPLKGSSKSVRQHRLLALSFIPNDDFITRPYVNHIDGDKTNNDLCNLEWCSDEENATHAAKLGLASDTIRIKARDVYTGQISHHHSLQDIVKTFGIPYSRLSMFRVNDGRLPGYLFNKRYEIKAEDDNSPWYYENTELDESAIGKRAYMTYTVYDKNNGETRTYNTGEALCKKYKIWLPSFRCDLIVDAMNKKYPHLKVSYVRNNVRGPYTVFNVIKNKIECVCVSLIDIEKCTGIGRNMIRDDLSRKNKYIYKEKYIILSNGDKTFNRDEYEIKPNQNKPVKLVNIETKEEKIFNSINQMCKFLNVDKRTGNRIYNTKSTYRDYEVRPILE